MTFRLVLALLLLAPAAASAQPGVDCRKTSTAVERALCGDAKLAPYAAGRYFVTIPYGLLGSLIRSNDLVQLAPVGNGRGG